MLNSYIFTMITGDRPAISNQTYRTIPAENYVVRSVKSLMKNGGFAAIQDIRLYDAGSPSLEYLQPIRDLFPSIKIFSSETLLPIATNTLRAWKDALETSTADWIISAQDDIVCSKNTFKKMDTWVKNCPANTGLLTLWFPYQRTSGPYVGYPPKLFWGNLFLILKRKVLEEFFVSKTYEVRKKMPKAMDMTVKHFFLERPEYKIYGHFPSLVEHVGETSTWNPTPAKRVSLNFKGEQFIAIN